MWKSAKKNVFQIHDDARKDRESLTMTWTKPFGISLQHFPAIMNREDGVKGCFDSHVTLAQQMSHKFTSEDLHYFVLEDDAVPTSDAHFNVELLTELERSIKTQEYDLIWLGGLPLPDFNFNRFQTLGILPGKCLTTYAMFVGPKARHFLSQLKFQEKPIDVILSQTTGLKTAYTNPPLFRQSCTPSDIGKSNFTRGKLFALGLETITPVWRMGVIYQNYILCLVFLLVFCKILAF